MAGKRKFVINLVSVIGILGLGYILAFKDVAIESMYYTALMVIVTAFYGANAIGDHKAFKKGDK